MCETPAPEPAAAGSIRVVERTVDDEGEVVVRLRGEIDLSNADAVEAEFRRVARAESGALIIDVSELQFIDSTGIAMLLNAVAGAESVAVRNPSPILRRMIDVAGLAPVLPIEDLPIEE